MKNPEGNTRRNGGKKSRISENNGRLQTHRCKKEMKPKSSNAHQTSTSGEHSAHVGVTDTAGSKVQRAHWTVGELPPGQKREKEKKTAFREGKG